MTASNPKGEGSIESEKLAHVTVVLGLAVLRAQVEAQLVDDLDAVVLQPVVPAVGADRFVDTPADLVTHGRARQLAGAAAHHTAGTLAAEAARLRPRLGNA